MKDKLLKRLVEPSTWGGIGLVLGMFGLIDMQQAAQVSTAATEIVEATKGSAVHLNGATIGAGLSALLAVFLGERGSK